MRLLRSPRLLLVTACAIAAVTGAVVAAERSSSSMANAATAFLNSLSAEQRQQAVFPFDSDERTALELHPDRSVPAQRPDRQRDDRGAAEAGARPAEGRAEPARLPDRFRHHGSRNACSAISSSAARRRGDSRRGRCDAIRSRYFFSVFGTPSAKGTWGWRVEGPPRLAALHRRERHAGRELAVVLRIEPGRSAARVRRRACGFSATEEDAARALLMALDDDAARQGGDHTNVAPNDIVTTNKRGHHAAVAGRASPPTR